MSAEKKVAINTEAMLLGWAESSTRGRTVTFLLPEDTDDHPMKAYSVKSGKRAGQRFQLVMVELGDDDRPVEQQQDTAQRLSQLAAVLCKDPLFQRFADERSFDDIHTEDAARAYICSGAGISSRRELDSNKAAAQWFRDHCHKPFLEYRQTVEGIL